MHLSQKQKGFCKLFCVFFKFISNFEHFQKKMTLIAYVFPKLRTPKNVVRQMLKKSRFRGPIDRQRGKQVKTLFQSRRKQPYHIH